jgi:hypothetical protein
MAIAAIDAKSANVVFMTERDRLRVYNGAIGVVSGALHHLKKPEQREHKNDPTEKYQPVDGVRVRME